LLAETTCNGSQAGEDGRLSQESHRRRRSRLFSWETAGVKLVEQFKQFRIRASLFVAGGLKDGRRA
jgi:hypothetical protein